MPKANFISENPSLFDQAVAARVEKWQDEFGRMNMIFIWAEGSNLGIVANGGDNHKAQVNLVVSALEQMVTDPDFGK